MRCSSEHLFPPVSFKNYFFFLSLSFSSSFFLNLNQDNQSFQKIISSQHLSSIHNALKKRREEKYKADHNIKGKKGLVWWHTVGLLFCRNTSKHCCSFLYTLKLANKHLQHLSNKGMCLPVYLANVVVWLANKAFDSFKSLMNYAWLHCGRLEMKATLQN